MNSGGVEAARLKSSNFLGAGDDRPLTRIDGDGKTSVGGVGRDAWMSSCRDGALAEDLGVFGALIMSEI